MPPVLFVGPFPPPIHGQAVATATIARLLEGRGIVLRRVNTGEAGAKSRWQGRAQRISGLLKAATYCLQPGGRAAYLSVSANAGMAFTAVLAGLARLVGKRVILHHHTYAHLTVRNRTMALLVRLAGPSAVHMTICPAMSQDLRSSYPEVINTAAFSNVDAVDRSMLDLTRERETPMVLGFMSNLTLDKGIERAIAAFRLAHSRGLASKLVVAGPCSDHGARAAIDAAVAEFGGHFRYLGPVGGETKLSFFAEIDVFLFPSLYKNETQGIVNLEALAAGVPVVAYGLCCIPSDLDDASCAVVPPDRPFDQAVYSFLQDLSDRFPAAAKGARDRFGTLVRAHEAEIDSLAALLSPPASPDTQPPQLSSIH